MLHYFWWIPLCIVGFAVHAWLSKMNNELGGKWLWITLGWGALFQVWVIVSRISKNLVFDAMLYDNILFLTYTLTLVFLGCGQKFSLAQWSGLCIIVLGSILMRSG